AVILRRRKHVCTNRQAHAIRMELATGLRSTSTTLALTTANHNRSLSRRISSPILPHRTSSKHPAKLARPDTGSSKPAHASILKPAQSVLASAIDDMLLHNPAQHKKRRSHTVSKHRIPHRLHNLLPIQLRSLGNILRRKTHLLRIPIEYRRSLSSRSAVHLNHIRHRLLKNPPSIINRQTLKSAPQSHKIFLCHAIDLTKQQPKLVQIFSGQHGLHLVVVFKSHRATLPEG